MADVLFRLLTGGVFCVVFGLTFAELVRLRDLPRLEIASLLGVLAAIVVLQGVTVLFPIAGPWVPLVMSLLLVSQPYLLLRLLASFQSISRFQHTLAVAGLIVSAGLLVALRAAELPGWAVGLIVVSFAYVEGVATLGFVRAAVSARGITQVRLFAVAVGSGLLGSVILLAGLIVVAPAARHAVSVSSDFLGLGSAISYYIGFTTPRWLRRVWQRAEVYQFLAGLTKHALGERDATALDYLSPAAARATGGRAVIALADLDADVPRLHPVGLLATIDVEPMPLGSASPELDRVLRERRPLALRESQTWGRPLQRLAGLLGGARAALIAPLTAGSQTYGLVIVFLERGSLFVDDDLATLDVLAQQTALAMDHRQLLQSAERGRAQLAMVMGSMSDGLILLDPSNTIQYCNERAAQLLGLRSEQLIGLKPPDARVWTEVTGDGETVPGDAWTRARQRAHERPTFHIQTPGPSPRTVLVQIFEVADPNGPQSGIGMALRDVTAERELARTKDELVSVVSHELRTPLASVVGFAELLLSRPSMPELHRQRYLGVMVEEGRRLTSLINDFLDMQRLESGHQKIAPRSADLRPLLEQAILAAGEDAERPIVLDVPDDLPTVRVDPVRLRQVLGNLLGNARKYSPGGGTICVEARRLDGQVCVAVQDHGLGLPASALPRLFGTFYRVDNSDRREITGTGLGLAISRRIVEGHGGRIWAESNGLGQGARFSFTVPVAPEQAASGEVLVVEDGDSFAQLLEAELAGHGLSAVCVSSAEEALEQVRLASPRMVVLDLMLPGMSGEAFLERLRVTDARAEMPVIVVTVKDLSVAEQEALAGYGVHCILRKGPGVAAAAARTVAETLRVDASRAA